MEAATDIIWEAAHMGLVINADKTKYMVASEPRADAAQSVNVGNQNVVEEFTYLGSAVNSVNLMSDEI